MRVLLISNQPKIINSTLERTDSLPKADFICTENSFEGKKAVSTKYQTGSAVAIAAIAAVGSVFMLSKGFQKGSRAFLNKAKEFFEKKSARSSLNESKQQKQLYEFSVRRLNSFITKLQSINNITSLKDILFMKFMYKTNPTKKIHKSISKYFEGISKKTVQDSYEKTRKYFEKMNKAFDELDEYILKNHAEEKVFWNGKECSKRELVEKAREKRDMSNIIIGAFMDNKTIESRYKYINDVTSTLYSTFWDASFKDFWTKENKFKRKEMWQTFIAAEQIRGNKTQFATWASIARNAVTYTEKDQTGNMLEYIRALDGIMPAGDKEGIEIIKKLEWFAKNPDVFANNKEEFFNELNKLKAHKFPLSSDNKMLETLDEYKNTNIGFIEKQITDNKPGLYQDMLSYYYKISPFELDESGALISLKRAVKSFDNSLEKEGVEFFDKVRDLRLGSAPTDVLTILFSFITLSLGLGHAKDKDTRTSIMLKSGIPIAGGIATSMYSAARLVSGGKSLALGFLSGIILNRLGVIADNIRKSRKEKIM